MSITLTHLATATLNLEPPISLANGPRGTRLVVEVIETTWEGDRLKAKLKGRAAADWALVSADGIVALDVRLTLETHDGAIIFVSYEGRAHMTDAGTSPIIVAPRFETGDERYKWLNQVQAIARGTIDEQGLLTYEVYEAQ
jgi:hypothetical protein